MQRIDYQLNSTKRLLMAAKDWSMTSNQQPATSNQQPATGGVI